MSLGANVAGAAPGDRAVTRAQSVIPLPPPRPIELGGRGDVVVLRHAVPESAAPVSVTIATLPRSLPTATRQRMRACGLEWQQIKWSGDAGERTWRDFAMGCLAQQ